jgi:hypothetical protein
MSERFVIVVVIHSDCIANPIECSFHNAVSAAGVCAVGEFISFEKLSRADPVTDLIVVQLFYAVFTRCSI